MSDLGKLPFVILSAFLVASFGYQEAFNYIGKVEESAQIFQKRMARVDLWSYLLTSVPLFGGMVIIFNKDPVFGAAFTMPQEWSEFVVTLPLLAVASLGIGAGVARRRWALIR